MTKQTRPGSRGQEHGAADAPRTSASQQQEPWLQPERDDAAVPRDHSFQSRTQTAARLGDRWRRSRNGRHVDRTSDVGMPNLTVPCLGRTVLPGFAALASTTLLFHFILRSFFCPLRGFPSGFSGFPSHLVGFTPFLFFSFRSFLNPFSLSAALSALCSARCVLIHARSSGPVSPSCVPISNNFSTSVFFFNFLFF